MADFDKAFKITILENEGGYNPGIGENETYRGIDRGANPHWSGWAIIDNIKKNNPDINITRINMLLATNTLLQANIKEFYKSGYWDTLKLNMVDNQQLANNLFDCAVNQGITLACKFMQLACNIIIASTKSAIKLLTIDHDIGVSTLFAFNALPPALLNAEINSLRLSSYQHDSGYARWGEIWKKRLTAYA